MSECLGPHLGRHVSVLRALQAFGLAEVEAKALITTTRAAGGLEYRVSRDGCSFLIRQMKGGHAEVSRATRSSEHGAGV